MKISNFKFLIETFEKVSFSLIFEFCRGLIYQTRHRKNTIITLNGRDKSRPYTTFSTVSIAKFLISGIIILGLTFYTPLQAGEPGSTVFNFLKIGVGPRAIGMGEAFSAVADDVTALYWNPAGILQLDRYEASFMHFRWFEDITYQYAALARSSKSHGAMGISVSRLAKDAIQGYDAGGTPLSNKLSFSDMAVALTYAYPLRIGFFRFAGGLTTKYIIEKIAGEKASAVAFDAGFLFPSFPAGPVPVTSALTVRNVGASVKFDSQSDDLPQSITVGFSGVLIPEQLIATLDYTLPDDNDAHINIGSEYYLIEFLALRIGYRTEIPANTDDLNNGVRYGIGFGNPDMRVDYAFTPYGDLGNAHRFGVTVRFGKQYRLRSFEKRTDTHLRKALKYYARKDLVLAHRELRNILALDPLHYKARILMQKISGKIGVINTERYRKRIEKLIREDKLIEARDECESILALQPDNATISALLQKINALFAVEKEERIRALFKQGEDFYAQEYYQDAIELWEKIILIEPMHAQAKEKIAATREELERQKKEEQKRYLARQFTRAETAGRKNKWRKAITLLEEIVSLNPSYPRAQELLSEAREKRSSVQKDESEKYLQEGISFYRSDDLENARASFKASVDADPYNKHARQYLTKVTALLDAIKQQKAQELNKKGLSAYARGNIKESISAFEEALKIYPEYEEAQNNLNRVRQELKP